MSERESLFSFPANPDRTVHAERDDLQIVRYLEAWLGDE